MMRNVTRRIAVIGAAGFVGSAVCQEVIRRGDYELIRVLRRDNAKLLIEDADIVIHTANPSKRYFAEKNPKSDFIESVEKTFILKRLFTDKKFILISSISARTQLETVYGRNRRACELIVNDYQGLIIRLGPMFSEQKRNGALYDIIKNNNVYVSEDTEYAFVNVRYNARKIIDLIDEVGLIELGARNSVRLSDLKQILKSSSVLKGPNDTQVPLNPPLDAPDVKDVIAFAVEMKRDFFH